MKIKVFKTDNDQENMCDNCEFEIPNCNMDDIKFGSGEGNDNIIQCSSYSGDQYKEVEVDVEF